jgi:hypothetical protein
MKRDLPLELRQLKDTSDGSDIETEKHASETSGASHGEGTPSIDLRRILLNSIVLDDGPDEAGTGTGSSAHDC